MPIRGVCEVAVHHHDSDDQCDQDDADGHQTDPTPPVGRGLVTGGRRVSSP